MHGARVVEALRRKVPGLFIFGIGGKALEAAGVRILVEAATLSVVGITEVFAKLPGLLRGMRCAKRALKQLKPDLLILIDFPDFNLHVAAAAKKAKIPILYYISPQIWAWRTGRVKKIGSLVDHVAVILPFEEKFYREHHIPVTFVGHPLLDAPLLPLRPRGPVDKERELTIGLLPGSRDREVATLLPIMLDAANLIESRGRRIRFVVSHASTVETSLFQTILDQQPAMATVAIQAGPVDQLFEKCDLIVAASGTVTLEAAIAGVPMIIIYRVSSLSYRLGRLLIQVPYIGLVNLINDEPVVTELVQDEVSATNIADTVDSLIADPARLQSMREKLYATREKLGGTGASGRVADIALDLMDAESARTGSRSRA
ncbi:MAG: lipid-A-disaccharide synthase [Desulfobacterales bacterium]|nr:lipid-A-disaccharide synthase [Desulfobacterales bacterium]